jgi:hypothetical protein
MNSWGDFCLDTWDQKKDEYNYALEGKSPETKDYLNMLKESFIEHDYVGACTCNDWNRFLLIELACIVTNQAPYSHIFYDERKNFFFYFHHTGSIGLYYEVETEAIKGIISAANQDYDVVNPS